MSDPKARRSLSHGETGVICFTAVYMVVSLIACLARKNPEFVFYLVVMCVLIATVITVHLKIGLHLAALWGLSIWGLAHMAGGLLPLPPSWPIKGDTSVLYNLWIVPEILKYDHLVHAYGFGVVTWICWQGICTAFSRHDVEAKPTLGLLALCVASGMGFGALNEIVEFIATITMPGTNVGGYINTGWDLVANFVGCVFSAILISHLHGSRKMSTY